MSVPASVPALGLVATDIVMTLAALVTVFPWASWTVTWTAGVMAAPAAVVLGWTLKARRLARAGTIAKAELVALLSPLAVALSV